MRWRSAAAILAALALFSFDGEAHSEETASPSWADLRPDRNVSGQAICSLAWYMLLQETQRFCKWPSARIDDALSEGVKALQDFLIANSSYHPTANTFIEMRRSIAEGISKADTKYTCGSSGYARVFETSKPEAFRDGLKTLLAKPARPDEITPCFP